MKKKKNTTNNTRAPKHTKLLRPDKTFQRPDVEDVQSYLSGFANLDFDAQYFLDYYDSIGWEVNGKQVCNWKAAIRLWN